MTGPGAPSDAAPRTAVAVVPAAGRSERFGGAKLVADVDGRPMLERVIRSLVDGGVGDVVVVLAPQSAAVPALVPALALPRVRTVVNPDPGRGMFSTVLTGLAGAEGDPILVLPGDLPFVRAKTVAAVVDEARRTGLLVVPTYRGERGHPVAIPGPLRQAVLSWDVASNLSACLKRLAPDRLELPVDDPGVLRDVDVPADLRG
jgi:molybdenum cofactor cytidylyltransferase